MTLLPAHRSGVLFITTGSPAEPTAEEVRAYLEGYLTDRRLVDTPRWQWYPILYGIILRKRPPRTAARYREIWTDGGSPLTIYTERQRAGIEEILRADGFEDVPVMVANRYCKPGIDEVLRAMISDEGVDHLVVITCYPQYASVTNGTFFQELLESLSRLRRIPSVSIIDSYPDVPGYLDALADKVSKTWSYAEDGHHAIIFSFHSTLCKDIEEGDVYKDQTELTMNLVCDKLGIASQDRFVGYHSVFDKGRPWLGPQTAEELIPMLAKRGVTNLAVVAPGFTVECLETLYDVNEQQRTVFMDLVPEGSFTYVPCLNDDPRLIEAMARLVEERLR